SRPFATDEILIGSHEKNTATRIARTASKKTFFFRGTGRPLDRGRPHSYRYEMENVCRLLPRFLVINELPPWGTDRYRMLAWCFRYPERRSQTRFAGLLTPAPVGGPCGAVCSVHERFRTRKTARGLRRRSFGTNTASPIKINVQVCGSGTTGTDAGSAGFRPARSYCAFVSKTTAPLSAVTS